MAQLTVHSVVPYLTNTDVKWRSQDHEALQFVKSLKGEPFNGYVNYKERKYTFENHLELARALMRRTGEKWLREKIHGPISIVPIPNSGMTVGAAGEFRIVRLANEMAEGYGADATVEPVLRWDSPREPAHLSKGPRSPEMFEPHLRLEGTPSRPVVLFDDVVTTGSQMIAAARLIRKATGTLPALCFAFGRATWTQEQKKVGWFEHTWEIDPVQ
jgi:phosphoribosylpyrophosphate synthetase